MTLKQGDLHDLVYHVLEIDSYKSKMGSDEEIITLSFSAKTKESADDLMNFVERGYEFVLDADVTPGEQSDGTYKIFVELERNKDAPNQILEIIDGIKNLAQVESFRFRYYKNWKSYPLTNDSLTEMLPLDSTDYATKVNESNLDNYKNFFNKSFIESVDMWDDVLCLKKAYANPLYFKFIDFGNTTETIQSINESFNPYDFAEIIFLSKYIGDYNITKYGNKLTFENKGKTLVVERINT